MYILEFYGLNIYRILKKILDAYIESSKIVYVKSYMFLFEGTGS